MFEREEPKSIPRGSVESKKISHVEGSLSSITSSIETTLDLVQQLESRLSPVLRSSLPSAEKEGDDREVKVPLAEGIDRITTKTYFINRQLRDVIERLEL